MMRLLIVLCSALTLTTASLANESPPGILEGHLKIVSLKSVELAEGNAPSVTATTYAEYPLAISSRSGEKEIAHLTADASGNYHLSLPPGDYVLDVQDRAHKHIRAQPKEFTVTSNQTVRVDMELDTGVR